MKHLFTYDGFSTFMTKTGSISIERKGLSYKIIPALKLNRVDYLNLSDFIFREVGKVTGCVTIANRTTEYFMNYM